MNVADRFDPWSTYIVVAGDTLWEIGRRYRVTTDALLAVNPQVTDRRLIRVGDEILIPSPDWTPPKRPLADSTVVDSDLDGEGDFAILGTVQVGFNHPDWTGELRGVYEFDLRGVPEDRDVAYAGLTIPEIGTNSEGTDPHLTLYAGAGDGRIDKSDFAGGTLVRHVNAYEFGSVIYLDLTDTFNRLRADGASFVTLVFRPSPSASSRRGTIMLASSEAGKYGFPETALTIMNDPADHGGSAATETDPLLVLQNVQFPGTGKWCSKFTGTIANYGDDIQLPGWSITIMVSPLGITKSFKVHEALAPAQRMSFHLNARITAPGKYEAVVSVGDSSGRTQTAHGAFSVPCSSSP